MNQIPTTKINSIDVFENRIEEVFRHIRNGGSLTQLSKLWKFDYSEFMKSIRSNPTLLNEYQSALEDRKEWAKERIYEELQYMGTYNIKDAVNPDGTLKTIHELPEDLARSIKEIDVDGGIKFTDKRASLADKQKLLGLTVEKLELTGKLTLADLINQAKKTEG
jgi:hypothetical protein